MSKKILVLGTGAQGATVAQRMAIIGTGSAPGMMCVATKISMRYLDTCDDILMMVYEGVVAKRFMPFWWSPFTALSDMTDPTFALVDGELVETEPHSLPVVRDFRGCRPGVVLVEHAHDETVYMGLNKDIHFKGAKNINIKYGGVGIEFSTPLYRAGLLSRKEETYKGHTFIPFDVIVSHLPPAPKFKDEIQEILDEGLVRDEGAFVVECTGTKNGILKLIISEPLTTMAEMAKELNVTKRTIGRVIKRMREEDKIVRKGGKRYGYWEIK